MTAIEKESDNNGSTEIQQEQELQEEETGGYQPLYANSYDLCADILTDVEAFENKINKAKTIMDVIATWYDLTEGMSFMLTKLKLEFLMHRIERGGEIVKVYFFEVYYTIM